MPAGYPHPDPSLPPLPDKPGVNLDTKFILEMYAQEIREHAVAAMYIYGLDLAQAERYKTHCFEAAQQLFDAASLLRLHYMKKPS